MDATALAARLLEPIPANLTAGIEVVRAADCSAEVVCEAPGRLANVIGSLHASGLVALVDATGLAALIAAVEDERQFDGVIPLGSVARLRFHRPARGRLTATCTLDATARAALQPLLSGEERRATLTTTVAIHDEDDVLVCNGAFDWKLRRITN
ncbi:DUF4442 domain-containing protein [Conexibacter sp. JD483]|uniref:PaaI family thioesterase n=1 Tax=unclassified Conexibacter TaxID=2627773 RepID=UPI0027248333|nr:MULTISPECIES: DUF4442 domain-containing protein [unclassified Conexibacter]MDO8189280.1 DUF4442 domain-containing protein [Conexibacter sp. CPCC 205706]MDO8201958.1 DUF4442 domain-containing protein [Conexibacter sp. CPCC 205762]MDR9372577.1 DUF4442 domain-containing protein [Conexibacter sp. JD483]